MANSYDQPQPRPGQAIAEAGTALSLAEPLVDQDLEEEDAEQEKRVTDLAGYVRHQWRIYKNHEETTDFEERCNHALRVYKGQYSQKQLTEIKQFGGSEVFAHITSTKCRGATALLRDIFSSTEQPWGLGATEVPELPIDLTDKVSQLVMAEVQHLQQAGQQVPREMIEDRIRNLLDAAMQAEEKNANKEAKRAEKYLQDLLVEGGYYAALVDFLVDLPIFPCAIIKGPVVRMVEEVKWENGQLVRKRVPKMRWYRVSPFDLLFTPGASSMDETATIEYQKLNRSELHKLIGLPGYNEVAIRGVLRDYPHGYVEYDADDAERAESEGREDPHFNQSGMLDTLEWQGTVPGKLLHEYGFTPQQVPEEGVDYFVTAWVVGRYVLKVQIHPYSSQRPNYYVSSFEKIPGSIRGLGLPEILDDAQRLANGSLRALANNMAMASGPQVAVDESRLSASTDADSMYPWKRWKFISDPQYSGQGDAISFFQPQSNAQELLGVYTAMTHIADETSSIPRYLTGDGKVGGAGRTASGLSMLMGSASKMMQVIASNIDRDIMRRVIEDLYQMVMLVDQGKQLRGDENIHVRGVEIARQRETERSRRLEFLQLVSNPVDNSIIGPRGRASVLRFLADDLGMPGNEIVPSDMQLKAQLEAQAQAQQAQEGQDTAGTNTPKPGDEGQAVQMAQTMRNQV